MIRKILRLRPDLSLSFYLIDFIFRRILRQNHGVKWAIHHTATIRAPKGLKRGVGVWPGDSPGVYINAQNGVEVGDYVNIGPYVSIVSTNHDFIDNSKHQSAEPIRIGAYSWLGAQSVILPGIELGPFTIVGAGAIVTKSFPDGYCVLGGNPATVIKQLDKEACEAFANEKKTK